MADQRSPLPEPEPSTPDQPRTGGDSTTPAPVKFALLLLLAFFVLLGLWITWPLISGG
jgi:hypothetical protein